MENAKTQERKTSHPYTEHIRLLLEKFLQSLEGTRHSDPIAYQRAIQRLALIFRRAVSPGGGRCRKPSHLTAVHEAAHYLAAINQRRLPRAVSLVDPSAAGHARNARRRNAHGWTDETLISHIFELMAGSLAENRLLLRHPSAEEAIREHPEDWEQISALLSDKDFTQRTALIYAALKKTNRWLQGNFDRVIILAKILIEREHLTRTEIEAEI